jgi:hypothetical protein
VEVLADDPQLAPDDLRVERLVGADPRLKKPVS